MLPLQLVLEGVLCTPSKLPDFQPTFTGLSLITSLKSFPTRLLIKSQSWLVCQEPTWKWKNWTDSLRISPWGLSTNLLQCSLFQFIPLETFKFFSKDVDMISGVQLNYYIHYRYNDWLCGIGLGWRNWPWQVLLAQDSRCAFLFVFWPSKEVVSSFQHKRMLCSWTLIRPMIVWLYVIRLESTKQKLSKTFSKVKTYCSVSLS